MAGQSSRAAAQAALPTAVRRLLLVSHSFVGLTALGGSAELLSFPKGNEYLPITYLNGTVFGSFLVPGLLLGAIVAGTNIFAAVLLALRREHAVDAAAIAGGTLLAWMIAEIALIGLHHWIDLLYLGLALGTLGLALFYMRRRGTLRDRWLIIVTAAETVGFAVPAATGALAAYAPWNEPTSWAALCAAGFVEGFLLGYGQASVWPLPVRRMHYAVYTGIAATFAWAVGLMPSALAGSAWRDAVPGVLLWPLAIALGLLALCGLGFAQYLELRRYSRAAHTWVTTTAIAWLVALPISFLPSPLVDEKTPVGTIVGLWLTAGATMAFVMSWLTYLGIHRVLVARPSAGSVDRTE